MKKPLLTLILASLLTLTACSPAADTKESSDVTPTEATIEATTETVTEPHIEKSTETEIKDISATKKLLTCYRDGLKLSGNIYLPEGDGAFPTIIMIGGQYESHFNLETDAVRIAENGIACVTFDCAGYCLGFSASDGNLEDMTLSSCVKDTKAVMDAIADYPMIDNNNLFLYGHSFGGIVTTLTASDFPDKIKGLISIEAGYSISDDYKEMVDELGEIPEPSEEMPLGKEMIEEAIAMDIYEKMPLYRGNVLVITGTGEESLGELYAEYYDRAVETFPNAEKFVIEGADHYFSAVEHKKTLRKAIVDFVKGNID